MHIDEKAKTVRFETYDTKHKEWVPAVFTRVVVRKELSKGRHKYEVYLAEEGCQHVANWLGKRMRDGETMTPNTSIITQKFMRSSEKVNFDYPT